MTPLDRFRASVALGILERTDAIGFLRAMGMEQSADAVEDIIEIVSREADEAATPASEPRNDAHSREHRPVPRVAAPYQEV